jgi:hypothetical protein
MAKNFRKLKIAVAAGALACALALLVNQLAANALVPVRADEKSRAGGEPVKEIAGYKGWTKANAEPVLMAPQVAILCARQMTPGGGHVYDKRNPHHEKFITVYVNEVGREAMLSQKKPKFPAGSVIVKEKLSARDSQSPELLTVMIKQEKGFNPANGDWEYMVVDGTGTKIEGRGRLENCQACHLANQKTDYVFRSYLSSEVAEGLK